MVKDPEVFFQEHANRKTLKRFKKIPSTMEITTATRPARGGNAYRHTKTGYRPDLEILTRSGWEANFLRVCKSYGIPYEFEPLIFYFPVRRGTKAYTPDVRLSDGWVEIKGYFDEHSRIKLKRFKLYYPDEFATLTMVISKYSTQSKKYCADLGVPSVLYYEDISQLYRDRVTNWEGK